MTRSFVPSGPSCAYREAAGLSRPQLAEALGCGYQWIEKMETGAKPSVASAIDLDTFFGIKGKTFQRMAEEIENAGRQAALLPGFPAFVRLEAKADYIRSFVAQVVPGLLQTERYSRSLIGSGQVRPALDDLVALRMSRQKILSRDKPPRLTFVIDESALRRPIGGPEVMREQLTRLKAMVTGSPTTQVRILPFDHITWAGLDGSFTILGFPDRRDVAHLEGPGSSQLVEDPNR